MPMKGFQRISCVFLIVLLLLFLMPFSAGAEINELSGTIWVLNTWQNPEENVSIAVTDEEAAIRWIGYYTEILFLNTYRYRLETVTEEGRSREEGNYRMSGPDTLVLEPEGEREGRVYSKIGSTISRYSSDTGMIGYVQSGHQTLYPENPVDETESVAEQVTEAGRSAVSTPADPFSGTRWVGTELGSAFSSMKFGEGDFNFSLKDIMSIATLVPSEQHLKSSAYLSAVLMYMDFNTDNSFELGMKTSVMGEIDESESLNMYGTWEYQDGILNIYVDGAFFPVLYQNGKILLSYTGFSITFSKLENK